MSDKERSAESRQESWRLRYGLTKWKALLFHRHTVSVQTVAVSRRLTSKGFCPSNHTALVEVAERKSRARDRHMKISD